MKASDYRRLVHHASALFSIDPDLLVAITFLRSQVSEEVHCIQEMYAAGMALRQKLTVFDGDILNALRAYHSGQNPQGWNDATEQFVRDVDDLYRAVKASRSEHSTGAAEKQCMPAAAGAMQ